MVMKLRCARTIAIVLVICLCSRYNYGSHGWISNARAEARTRRFMYQRSPETVKEDDAWDALAKSIAFCLVKSDLKRDSGFDGSSTGWTSWVEESSALRLQKCIDKLIFLDTTKAIFNVTSEQDELVRWLKWMKSSPSPAIVEMSERIQQAVNATLSPKTLENIVQTYDEFLSRIGCRIMLLPSGMSLRTNLRTAPGAMVYGKILYGGVIRYRVIGSSSRKRKAGERTLIASQGEATESWLQYGGPERNYDAVDMGPAALMELTILPKGLSLPLLGTDEDNLEMSVLHAQCNPGFFFRFPERETLSRSPVDKASRHEINQTLNESANDSIEDLQARFSTVVGGLNKEVDSIIRRVLDGRKTSKTSDSAEAHDDDMKFMFDLGLHPVKGLLLYGPPGCGKTALAREISRLLTERPPKIVSAPELLDRWVGGSEKLVRDLFGDAEAELKACNGDPLKSGLHVIVIDEVDAVFRKRSSSTDSGEVARASAVNQILAKLDGVHALGNVLVIGTTNRKELLDKALLRPGRLEVQVEIPPPDKEGRREILKIHFYALRRRGRLSKPLCEAIDGTSQRNKPLHGIRSFYPFSRAYTGSGDRVDFASDKWTKGLSGADLQGLVRSAGSIALSRARKDGSGVEGLLITVDDVISALDEIRS